MRKAPKPDSQRPKQRDSLSFPHISTFITTVLSIFLALFGTAWTFSLAYKPQPIAFEQGRSERGGTQSPLWGLGGKGESERKQGNTEIQGQGKFSSSIPRTISAWSSAFHHTKDWGLVQAGRNNLPIQFPPSSSRPLFPSLTDLPTSSGQTLTSTVTSQPEWTLERQSTYTKQEETTQTRVKQPTKPTVAPNLNPNQSQPTPKAREVKLTLSDVVILALENNRPIKNAYLERIAQRQDLAVAESKFTPTFAPVVSIVIDRFGRTRTTTDADLGLGATLAVKVPTGGELRFRWATNNQTFFSEGLNLNINDDPFGQNLQLSFNQPLLRGAGINANRASIDISRLTERVNILDLKSTLINTLTDAIVAYRELIRSQERLKIAQLSLQRAQESLANNQALIEAGRLAPVDIVQSETEVARRQVSLIEAQNNIEAARLALLNILDIDKATVIVAADPPTASAVSLNPDKLRQLAFANQPDYLRAQLDLERTKRVLLLAENNRQWDLSLNTSYGYASNDTTDVRVGLALSRTIGDLTIERDFQRSLVNQLQAENTLNERRESLEIQLTDRIRDVNLSFAQVELARKATASSERQLEIARDKQRLGRDITVFEIVRLQDDLVQARNVELNAIISYLNALTRLDQTLGTTLDTWQVTIEKIEKK